MEVQIITGFLGSGKTTFLNKYLPALPGRTVIIENEMGSVGVDQDLIPKELPVKEIFSGCICCTLQVNFISGIAEICEKYRPDRIVIEPSGIGRLSDVIGACLTAKSRSNPDLEVTKLIGIVDMECYEDFKEDFGPFYMDQVKNAGFLCFSNIDAVDTSEQARLTQMLHEDNPQAVIYSKDWRLLSSQELASMVEASPSYAELSHEKVDRSPGIVFTSIAIEEFRKMTTEELEGIFERLAEGSFGKILRGKGIVTDLSGVKRVFQYTTTQFEVYEAEPGTGAACDEDRIVIIGCGLDEMKIRSLFQDAETAADEAFEAHLTKDNRYTAKEMKKFST